MAKTVETSVTISTNLGAMHAQIEVENRFKELVNNFKMVCVSPHTTQPMKYVVVFQYDN